jgi:hypothetical protein
MKFRPSPGKEFSVTRMETGVTLIFAFVGGVFAGIGLYVVLVVAKGAGLE